MGDNFWAPIPDLRSTHPDRGTAVYRSSRSGLVSHDAKARRITIGPAIFIFDVQPVETGFGEAHHSSKRLRLHDETTAPVKWKGFTHTPVRCVVRVNLSERSSHGSCHLELAGIGGEKAGENGGEKCAARRRWPKKGQQTLTELGSYFACTAATAEQQHSFSLLCLCWICFITCISAPHVSLCLAACLSTLFSLSAPSRSASSFPYRSGNLPTSHARCAFHLLSLLGPQMLVASTQEVADISRPSEKSKRLEQQKHKTHFCPEIIYGTLHDSSSADRQKTATFRKRREQSLDGRPPWKN